MRTEDAFVEDVPEVEGPVDEDAALADSVLGEAAAVVDDVPQFRRRPGRPPKMADPRLRQLAVKRRAGSEDGGSWWTRPGADFRREAERMHAQNTSTVHNLVGWKAVEGGGMGVGKSGRG